MRRQRLSRRWPISRSRGGSVGRLLASACSDSRDSTGAFRPLAATALAARGWKRTHGLPKSPQGPQCALRGINLGCGPGSLKTIATNKIRLGVLKVGLNPCRRRQIIGPPYALSSALSSPHLGYCYSLPNSLPKALCHVTEAAGERTKDHRLQHASAQRAVSRAGWAGAERRGACCRLVPRASPASLQC